MGHLNFYNLVKINRKEAVKEIPHISKPTNTLCEHFIQGKKLGPSLNQKSTP
jgi:hypothetical protein